MKKLFLISISISIGKQKEFVPEIMLKALERKSEYVCVANVHMLVEAYKDHSFARVVNNADITTPDGVPLTWAMRGIHKIKQERVAGMDLLPALLQKAAELKLPVYFYGGTDEMLTKTRTYLKVNFPHVEIAGTLSPPFRALTPEEDEQIVTQINSSGAALVFVVLGCPKQERWMAAMKGRINAMMVGIGGALPVLVGMQKRAPLWMQKAGFEWLFRLAQEPKRLFKRYAITNSVFVYLLLKELYRPRIKRYKTITSDPV
jgi:N-acetylglucosaminyldiphosphoundecaprenol N-acetyl-beta-D-mannosaminyltransferase